MKKWLPAFWALLFCLPVAAWSQVDFRKETIYFLLPTRFFDGDPSNNRPNEWCSWYPGNPNNANFSGPEDVTWRGDFKGLIQQLDYIKDLGFTAIWITPVVQNRGPLDYHGYHAWDFTRVDPRLESPGATFKDFIDAAHAKGMKVVLDIVTNHSGRFGIKGQAELRYNTDTTAPWGKSLQGTALKDNPNWEYDGLTPNPDDGKLWSRANLAKMPPPFNQNLKAHNWPSTESFVTTSNPQWFHQSGNGFAQGWDDTTNLYLRALADDCPDLNTSSPVVQDYFFNVYKRYLDMGVDAFRWDTWKHMGRQDILAMYDRFKAYKPSLFVFGEVAQKRHELHPVEEINPHWYTWRGAVKNSAPAGVGVVDFYAMSTFHGVFQNGGALSGVTAAARYDDLYGDPSLLVTFLDNHDFGPNNDWNQRYGGSDENLAACMNFMFTWRGIPSVYYGTEARFKAGAYTDLHNAGGINRSINETGRAYFGDLLPTAPSHRIYQHIKKLNAIRKAVPALQNGNWQWAGNAPFNAVGYTRQSGSSFVCVGLAKDGSAAFNFTNVQNGVYRDAVTGREINVTNGNLAFTVTSGSAGIYVKDGPGMIGESGAGFFEPCVSGCVAPVKLQISPASDNYNAPVMVSMQASGGNGGKTIYYTLDGSTPTTASPVYNAPFSVSTLTVVRAIAVDANGRQSELEAQRYSFVLPPPVLSITPAAGNYFDPISVSMSASSGTAPYSIYYTTNGAEPSTASAQYSTPLPISTATTLKAFVRDAAGNQSAVQTRSYSFNIPAPVVTVSPASGNFAGGSVNVSLSATSPRPPVSIYYSTDGSRPGTGSTLYSGPIALSGGNPDTLKYIAIDAEGRQGEVQTGVYTYFPIPDITIYFKRPANWGTGVRIHYWNAQPANVLAATAWPGLPMTRVCGDWYSFRFSGVTSVNIVFNDGAGRQTGDLSATATAYYDNGWLNTAPDIEAPVANFSATPGLTGTAPFEVTLNGSLSTACNGITSYTWNFGNGQTGAGAQPTTVFATPGIYSVQLTVTDNAGKASVVSRTLTVNAAAAGFWVYFKRPANWGTNIRLRYWNRMPGNTSITAPGEAMTPHCGLWYKYFFANTSASFLSITDGTNTTTDLQANQHTSFIGSRKVLGAPDAEQTLFANFEVSPATGRAPLQVSMNTEVSIGCQAITGYAWNFGNGQTGTGAAPTVTYQADGVYSINLAVTDAGGQTHNLSKKIVVGPAEPSLKIHFRRPLGWTNTPSLYWWQPTPAVASPGWPGTTMQEEGNGWYVLEVPGARCANVIMNNTSSPQTADQLNICGEQWFDNGWLSQLVTNNALPIRLLGLQVKALAGGNELQWQAAEDGDALRYEVERSADGRRYSTVATVAAQRRSRASYTWLDQNDVQRPVWYYRLRWWLANGTAGTSQVLAVRRSSLQQVQVLPNPARTAALLDWGMPLTKPATLRMLNTNGVAMQQWSLAAGQRQLRIYRATQVPAGFYWMEMTTADGRKQVVRLQWE